MKVNFIETSSGSATISADGKRRFTLGRRINDEAVNWHRVALFIMLNPSTADAADDDPTIRKCVGYAKAWDLARLEVVNLFSFRSPEPKALLDQHDTPHDVDQNLRIIIRSARSAAKVVCAWGGPYQPRTLQRRIDERAQLVGHALIANGISAHCLETTKDAHPRHPLYLKGDLRPRPFTPPTSVWFQRPIVRASGDVVCNGCGALYREHALDWRYLSNDGEPFLHLLCNGRLVKL